VAAHKGAENYAGYSQKIQDITLSVSDPAFFHESLFTRNAPPTAWAHGAADGPQEHHTALARIIFLKKDFLHKITLIAQNTVDFSINPYIESVLYNYRLRANGKD